MDQTQQQTILRAIAVSALHLPQFTQTDRQQAFQILEDLKKYDGRIPLILPWLSQEKHFYEQHDITTATKLLALEILSAFLQKGYATISDTDRQQLRNSVLQAARFAAGSTIDEETRILAKKIALILEGIAVRDFPQRWTTFTNEMFAPHASGGLWYNEPGTEAVHDMGVRICLECLKVLAEDCTDSDFNARISTARRNDVLIGLNEVSGEFLPLLFQLLEHYPILQQSKAALHNMHSFLLTNNRTISSLTAGESAQYQLQVRQRRDTAQMIADTLATLGKFCCSMPVSWVLGGQHDFVAAMLHLLREPECQIQVRAVECLEQVALRGKLEFSQWMRLIRELPPAVQEANRYFTSEQEQVASERAARAQGGITLDALTLQLEFHRSLSRMLAHVLSSHLAHITSSKQILAGRGPYFEELNTFLRLLVDMLHHPSGRICSEQLNMWTALLRDPQIPRTRLLQPYAQELMTCYMDHMVKLRWEDIEDQIHPQTQLLEASYDDEEDYESWMADLRSKASLFFKFLGNTEPQIVTKVLNTRLQYLLTNYGNGEPRNHIDSSNNQLTQKSDAVIQFEGIYHPLDNSLSGVPSWTLNSEAKAPKDAKDRAEVLANTQAALSELAQALVSWEPTYVWLKFRRATLLDSLKHYWSKSNDQLVSSTLLKGVDSLLRYLGLPDEWNTQGLNKDGMSGEIVGLKKKSGVTLVSVSRRVPDRLVPWLSQLSDATRSLLSSEGLIPMNQMHLYEFLSCVATAVQDPVARSNFIGNVLSNAVETLEMAEVQEGISSAASLLKTFGIVQAVDRPESVTDPANVKMITSNYNRLFTALNRLLSVGKRCNEAAKKRIATEGVCVGRLSQSSDQLNFPDEGPMSLQELSFTDPFAPLWPRILPSVLNIYEATLSIWRPEHQAILLQNPYQRYVYAISDDEAFLAKNQDNKSGGVFGEGGTAGSVVAGTNRRDVNLVPRWSGWFNELRNTCFQLIGLLATQRVLFAPEIVNLYPRLVAVIVDPLNLKSMEHRHLTQFLKHVVELLLVSCPATMYATHLGPIIGPIFEHMRDRLEKTWSPVLDGASPNHVNGSSSASTKALTSIDAASAAAFATSAGDEWFSWYYSHSGLFVGDLDSVSAEAAVEKYRVDISRTYSDVLQVALALKGDWALVLANQAKEEQALKRNDPSRMASGPRNRLADEGVEVNADGTPKSAFQTAIDARKLLRINGLCHFLLLENERVAGSVATAVIQCLTYPDAYTCRRITKICHRILETVAWSPQYSQLLGQHMFTRVIKNIVTEPKWMVGMEWDVINVIRDIYGRLVLGQMFLQGGQGPGLQQNEVGTCQYEQAKTVDRPLQGGGILTVSSDYPRQVLLSLPGISTVMVEQLEKDMKRKRSAKDQKDFIRDILRVAADNLKEMTPASEGASAASGIFDRALAEESLLHSKSRSVPVPALPEKLVTRSQMEKKAKKKSQEEPEGLSSFQL